MANTRGFAQSTALALFWDHAQPGSDGSAVSKMAWDLRGEQASGFLPQPRNGPEASDIGS